MEKVLKVNDKEYKIRLTSWQVKCLEEREGRGLISILQDIESSGSVIQPIIKILHASLLHNHKDLNIKDVYAIYDDLVEYEGYNVDKLGELVMNILKTAGLFSGKLEK